MRKIITIFSSLLMLLIIADNSAFAFPGSKPKKEGQANTQQSQMPANIRHGMEKAKTILAARVNGTDITMHSVLKMMNRIALQKGRTASQSGTPEELKQEAINRLIFQELAFQKALADGIKIEKESIETSLSNLKQRLISEERYLKFLEHEMLTENELISEIEKGLLLEKIYSKEVIEKAEISEDEIRKAYEKDKKDYKQNERMLFTDIVFFLDINDPASFITAEKILKKLNEEADRNPHKLAPDNSFAIRDVEIKEDKDKENDIELYETAKKLKKGEVSGIIRTSDSLHIIKLVEYTPEKQFSFEEVKSLINNKLRAQAIQKRQQEWEEELKKDAKIEIIEAGDKK